MKGIADRIGRLAWRVPLAVLLGCSNGMPPATDGPTAAAEALYGASDDWRFPPSTVPVARSRRGMVASTDEVASAVGAEILARGGNAVDAAIATHFALAVVNPEAGNIGGGGFMIVHLADGTSAALDFREKAPLRSTRDMFIGPDGEPTGASRAGYLSNGVPGSVAGMWEAHERFGSLPWSELVIPAAELADGIAVHPRLAESLAEYRDRLRQNDATRAALLLNGEAPRVGERLAQTDLAATLRRIAADGKDGFYDGETARLIVAEMERGGGLISARDLAEYDAIWRDPIVFPYRDRTIISMPPPSSGGATMAEAFHILEGWDLGSMDYHGAEHVHLYTEALKRAFADRNFYLADPDFVKGQPIGEMISRSYGERRRAEISPVRATPATDVEPGLGERGAGPLPPEGQNTTHYSVVDGAGNAVSVTTTLNSLYGNGITVTGAGFLLNNEMDDFASRPGRPNMFGLVEGEANTVAPGKRMLSSMTPSIVLDSTGALEMVVGCPGGPTIITSVMQTISNVVDFGMDAAEAVGAPRLHHQWLPDELRFEEAGLTDGVVSALRGMGHEVNGRSGYSGDIQLIVMEDGVATGASDPRRGGMPVGAGR